MTDPALGAELDAPPPYPGRLALELVISVERSATRRICAGCRKRRVLFTLVAAGAELDERRASGALCSACSGLLVHGGRHT